MMVLIVMLVVIMSIVSVVVRETMAHEVESRYEGILCMLS